jgi:hypothetical protein
MKGAATFCMLAQLWIACGCGPSESVRRIRSFSEADCRAVQVIAEKLCASHIPAKDEDGDMMTGLLFGDLIPKELAYLKPQAVRIRRHFLDVYLYKTPAAEDSIVVRQGQDGVWSVEIHEGSWKNESKVIWSSKKEANQPTETTRGK